MRLHARRTTTGCAILRMRERARLLLLTKHAPYSIRLAT
jgi:hypothetical protein